MLETNYDKLRSSFAHNFKLRRYGKGATIPGGPGGSAAEAGHDITEREPIFLKDKGDAFFKAGNYRSALSAYSQAVDTEKQAPHPVPPARYCLPRHP